MYLNKTAASFLLINLLIDGAIKKDWNKITPQIIPEARKGKLWVIAISFLNKKVKIKLVNEIDSVLRT